MSTQEEKTSSMKKLLVIINENDIDKIPTLEISDILKAAMGDKEPPQGVQRFCSNTFLIDTRKNMPFFVSLLHSVFHHSVRVVVFSLDKEALVYQSP